MVVLEIVTLVVVENLVGVSNRFIIIEAVTIEMGVVTDLMNGFKKVFLKMTLPS